jgi:hypothetical protein
VAELPSWLDYLPYHSFTAFRGLPFILIMILRIDGKFNAAFLLLLLLLIPQLVNAQQDLASFPDNSRFDPSVADEDILPCTIPPYQDGSLNYLPAGQGYCPQQESPLENVTQQVLDELAVA